MEATLLRAACVGASMGADIAINYPMWIVAKRVGAGLSPAVPPLSRLYVGGGALWLSLGPTTVIEDGATSALQALAPGRDLLSAAFSGVVAGLCVTSQVEHVITAAHARGAGILGTARSCLKERGAFFLLFPPGMVATACREIPFAATLFHVRPLLSRRFGAAAEASAAERVLRECLCGCAASAVASPASHAPSVVAAYQQATGAPLLRAVADLHAAGGWRTFFRGLAARTVSLAGTFTVVPVALDALTRRCGALVAPEEN